MEMSLKEVAAREFLTKQAIYVALRQGRISAIKRSGKWVINSQQLSDFKNNRYNKALSKYNGKLIFDKSQGYHTVKEAAKILGCYYQHVYHACRWGKLKSHRIRASWVIHIDDIKDYKKRMRIQRRAH